MNTEESVTTDVKSDEQQEKVQDANTSEKSVHMIPKSRLDQEISKRKEAEHMIEKIAQDFVDAVPENMRDLIPNLSPADKITWIKSAIDRGLFTEIKESGPDSKRPSGKQPTDLSNLSPFELRRMGYKK